jgi:hypothetical protein
MITSEQNAAIVSGSSLWTAIAADLITMAFSECRPLKNWGRGSEMNGHPKEGTS